MNLQKPHSKKLTYPALVSLGAALLFVVRPAFAQVPPMPTSTGQTQTGVQARANDFDNDVKQGKDELKKDPEARKHQKEVLDGEDGVAGEGDGQSDQKNVDEFSDIREAEDNQSISEEDRDIDNSGIDEVDDANDLDEQSQEVINEHQDQEEGEQVRAEEENRQAQTNTEQGRSQQSEEQNRSEVPTGSE